MFCYIFSEICQYFNSIIRNETDVSASIAAIRTLLKVLERSKCKYKYLLIKEDIHLELSFLYIYLCRYCSRNGSRTSNLLTRCN